MRTRRLLVVSIMALLLAAVVAAPASSALPGPPGKQSRAGDIRNIAMSDPQVVGLLNLRPSLLVETEYDAKTDDWRVSIRPVGGSTEFGVLVIDDTSHQVTLHDVAKLNDLPPMSTSDQATAVARGDREVREAADEHGGIDKLVARASYVEDDYWEVDFRKDGDIKVRVDVSDGGENVTGVWTDHQIAWKMARGDRYSFGGDINLPYVWWTLAVAFALLMVDVRRLRSWHNLDILVLLSFLVSHELFAHGEIGWSVPLAYPPLVYLFLRMSWLFLRGVPAARGNPADASWTIVTAHDTTDNPTRARMLRARVTRVTAWFSPWPPTWLLWTIAVFAAGLRFGINAYGSNVIDVGYAGVSGAASILDGETPYGNMPSDNENGDTYGPLNYLLYVPATFLLKDPAVWEEGLPAAHATTAAADIVCVLALVWVGWRWMSGRAAAMLAAGWMTFPFTAYALSNNVNDVIVAALLLCAFAALPHAWLRGALIAAAGAVKFVPLAVAPVLAHAGTRGRLRQAVAASLAGLVVIGACAVWLGSYDDGLKKFWEATVGFQYERDSPFSVWGLYEWRTAQQVLQGALVLGLLVSLWLPHRRDFRQIAAGMSAAMLGGQLVLQHWFYLYIPWFFGTMLVVLVALRECQTAPLAPRPPDHVAERPITSCTDLAPGISSSRCSPAAAGD